MITPETKIKLFRDVEKLTLKMFKVPDDKLNMNTFDFCAFGHFVALTDEILEPIRGLRSDDPVEQASLEMFAVGYDNNYPNPCGRKGKLEFRVRALKFIEAVRDHRS